MVMCYIKTKEFFLGDGESVMKIQKILNNNVVVVKDRNSMEKIVMGRGIAYKKKVGETFDETKIDKEFTLSNKDAVNKFQELIADISIDYIELAEEIISDINAKKGKKLNEMVYINLVDHIYTSIERFRKGITVKNVMLWEIRKFYSEEFFVGLNALDMIEKRYHVRLPEDEAGFIALHIVNAEIDEENMQNMYQITKFMKEILNIVKYKFHVIFDEDSIYYYRFVTHLKYFAHRMISKKKYKDENVDDLFEIIKEKYGNSYDCVHAISEFILKKYKYVLSNEEKLYLTIHIERVIYKSMK